MPALGSLDVVAGRLNVTQPPLIPLRGAAGRLELTRRVAQRVLSFVQRFVRGRRRGFDLAQTSGGLVRAATIVVNLYLAMSPAKRIVRNGRSPPTNSRNALWRNAICHAKTVARHRDSRLVADSTNFVGTRTRRSCQNEPA